MLALEMPSNHTISINAEFKHDINILIPSNRFLSNQGKRPFLVTGEINIPGPSNDRPHIKTSLHYCSCVSFTLLPVDVSTEVRCHAEADSLMQPMYYTIIMISVQ